MNKNTPPTTHPSAPQARQRAFTDTHHGITRHDEFAWLRDENWQQIMHDPQNLNVEIRAHLEAENAYTDAIMADTQDLQEALFAQMRDRIEEEDMSVPVNDGALAWATRFCAGGEHALICCGGRDTKTPDMQIVIDGNKEAEPFTFFKMIDHAPDPTGRKLAWAYDDKGGEYITIKCRDIKSGKDLPDRLDDTAGAFGWSACGGYLFYVMLDKNHRPNRVMRHQLGSQQKDDICIYRERDAGFFVGLTRTRSGRFLIISAHDHTTSESWLLPTDQPDVPPCCVAPRCAGIEYEIDDDAARNQLIIVTNWDKNGKAQDFQIVTAPVPKTTGSMNDWHVREAHCKGRLILSALIFKNHLVILARQNALPHIDIIDMDSDTRRQINFAQAAYDLHLGDMAEYDTSNLRFIYASMTTPSQTYDFDMHSGKRILRKSQRVPNHDPQNYVTRRITATSYDGAQVPISLLYHKDTKLDGSAPALLYGYGAYGLTIPAAFSTSRLSLVDRGFIYAIAHIRGGKACGYDWFSQGRGAKKTNSFEDFRAAAHALIEQNYSQSGRITLHGGSAGGLLVGATLNLQPDLFCGAVAEVPFVDVLTTMLDDSLPLTPPEWPEWGNPITDKAAYQKIASYAPYENIMATNYPHILATGGLTDPRVTYWEPAKYVARMRTMRQDNKLTLLRIEMSAGHGGKAGRFNRLREIAFIYAFVLKIHNYI